MPLFTSIPVRLVTDFIKTKCQKSDGWNETTTLMELQAIDLLEFVLGKRYFTYQRMYYHQLFSCPMGPPISTVVADPVMANRGTGLVYISSYSSLVVEVCTQLQCMLEGYRPQTFQQIQSKLCWQ